MITLFEIPLTAAPQSFNIRLGGVEYKLYLRWNAADDAGWLIDLWTGDNNICITAGVPLVTGCDLLAQYNYLNIEGQLIVYSDFTDLAPGYSAIGDIIKVGFIPNNEA